MTYHIISYHIIFLHSDNLHTIHKISKLIVIVQNNLTTHVFLYLLKIANLI